LSLRGRRRRGAFFMSCRGALTERSPAVPEREKEASRRGHAETNPRGRPGRGRAGEGEQRGMPPALKNRSEAVRRPHPTAGKIGASPEKFRRGVKHKREEKFSI